MAPDCIGNEVQAMVDKLQPGHVLLLENVRFHKQEEKNDPEFAKQVRQQHPVYQIKSKDGIRTSSGCHW